MPLVLRVPQTLGNHEFDGGPQVLANYLGNLTFPLVTCNVKVNNKSDPLYPYIKKANRPLVKRIKLANGLFARVGFVGWTTPDTNVTSSPGKNVVFEDPVAATKACVQKLQLRGVNIIIGIGHWGVGDPGDYKVAAEVPGTALRRRTCPRLRHA